MSCARLLRPLSLTLSTTTTTAQFALAEDWEPIDDGALMDFDLNLLGVTGLFTAKPCLQLATVRADAPAGPAAITNGSYTGTAGHTHFHETAAGGTGNLLARVGVAYKLSSGSTLGTGQLILTPALKTCLRLYSPRFIQVNPGMTTSTDINYFELTDFLPAVGLSKVKCVFMVTDNSGSSLEYQLVMRSAVDARAPNSWTTCESAWTNPVIANTSRNTGEIAPPAGVSITSNLLFQLGVAFRKTGASNPRAGITGIPAVLYA